MVNFKTVKSFSSTYILAFSNTSSFETDKICKGILSLVKKTEGDSK